MVKTKIYMRHLTNADDRRCKLTEEDIADLKDMYYSGKYLMKELAEIFNVHVDTIRFYLHPRIRSKKNYQAACYYYRQKGETNE